MSSADLRISASDGRALGATLFRPEAPSGASVIIAPALGIRRRLYSSFAVELARHGARVLTFDCRGMGDSRDGPLRRDPALMSDWGEKDLAGVLAWLRRQQPGAPSAWWATAPAGS